MNTGHRNVEMNIVKLSAFLVQDVTMLRNVIGELQGGGTLMQRTASARPATAGQLMIVELAPS